MNLRIVFLFNSIIFFNSALAAKNNLNVLLINPSIENDPFWHQVETLTKKLQKI